MGIFVNLKLSSASKAKEVNNARAELFHKKFTSGKKAIDLSALPPCFSVFKLHCQRANMVAAIWRRCGNVIVDQANINSHGWCENGNIVWVKDVFPNNMSNILLDPAYDPKGDLNNDDNDEESDDETI